MLYDFLKRIMAVLTDEELTLLMVEGRTEEYRRIDKKIEAGYFSTLNESEQKLCWEGAKLAAVKAYNDRMKYGLYVSLRIVEKEIALDKERNHQENV